MPIAKFWQTKQLSNNLKLKIYWDVRNCLFEMRNIRALFIVFFESFYAYMTPYF
jgi:hypothetical protein